MVIETHKLVGEMVDHSFTTSKTSGAFKKKLPDTLVIHYTAGRDALSSVRTLTKPEIKASAHVVVGRDLKIYQLAPFNMITWHAGRSKWQDRSGLNKYGIGIEIDNAGRLYPGLEGAYYSWFGKSYPKEEVVEAVHRNESNPSFWHRFPEKQLVLVQELCECLLESYPIKTIVGHEEISPGRKSDPGPAFPLDKLRHQLLYADRESDEPQEDEPFGNEGVVLAGKLNIRRNPTVGAKPVRAPLKKGTLVKVVDEQNGWYKVKVETEGWVSGKWIDMI